MATRTFLLEQDLTAARDLLLSGLVRDDVKESVVPKDLVARRQNFSRWLESKLLERLQSIGDFLELEPVLLGSWARHELMPRSDIDLLFVGPEAKVQEFIGKAFRAGLKLRARTPEDLNDWSVGVEPFDWLALESARALNDDVARKLEPQRKIASQKRRQILAAVRAEREERRKRQDSIAGFLEPNLKFGVGGLRDIEQSLAIRSLFKEKFVESYPFEVLGGIKEELLYLRALLHLAGSNEILSAHDQLSISEQLGLKESVAPLMKWVQSELERASFYGDWAVAFPASLKTQRSKTREWSTLDVAIADLKKHTSIDTQYRIRLQVDKLARDLSVKDRGAILHKALVGDSPDAFLVSLHRARVFEVLIPDLKKLRGLVQHDHYHRFTADSHLVQTLREVQRSKDQKRALGALSKLTRDLTATEWWALKLTALFHDLAKGRKSDHSTEGAKLVEKYFTQWEYPENLKEDVKWLVENHLLVSTAAFRQNPQSPLTWKRLFDRGVHGRRLILLSLFTAIDIRATNPEAWTDWKAQLLLNLVESLRSPQAESFQKHLKYAGQSRKKQVQDWLLKLDPLLMQSLPPKILIDDLLDVSESKVDAPPKVIRRGGRVWLRMHRRQDVTGLFLGFVERLFTLGLNVQISTVATLADIGAYDWFCLKTDKSLKVIQAWMSAENAGAVKLPVVKFQSIELMSQDAEEWIISFRGRDQRGILVTAARALVDQNLSLRWARVHTWGQQIEDIFSVQPSGEVETALLQLRTRLAGPQ